MAQGGGQTVPGITYVDPKSIPTAINTTHMNPQEAAMAQEAALRGSKQVGDAFGTSAHDVNYMLAEEKKAALRSQWRDKQAADRAQAQQDQLAAKQKSAADDLWVAQQHSILATNATNRMQAALSARTPGGNLGAEQTQAFQKETGEVLQGAPSPEAANKLAIKELAVVPVIAAHGNTLQAHVNSGYTANSLDQAGQQGAARLAVDPTQVDDIQHNLFQMKEALKATPGQDPQAVEKKFNEVSANINKTYYGYQLQKDPEKALVDAQSGRLNFSPADMKQANAQYDQTIKGKFEQAKADLNTVTDSVKGGMLPPQDTPQKVARADALAQQYANNPDYAAEAQALADHSQEVQGTVAASQGIKGMSPAQVKQSQLGVYSYLQQTPGNPVDLGVARNTASMLDARSKLYKQGSYADVEQADGTMPPPSQKFSADLNKNPQAAQQWANESAIRSDQLTAKYGYNKDGTPQTDISQAQIKTFSQQLKSMDPVAQRDAMQFLNTLRPDLRTTVLSKLGKEYGDDSAMQWSIENAQTNPQMSKDVATGQAAMSKSGGQLAQGTKPEDRSAAIAQVFGGLYAEDPGTVKKFAGAADALNAQRVLNGQTSDYTKALQDVSGVTNAKQSGGGIFEGSKYPTIAPMIPDPTPRQPGDPTDKSQYRRMTGDELNTTLNGMHDSNDLAKYGNGVPVDPVTGKTPDLSQMSMSAFKMQPSGTGDGQYRFFLGPTQNGQTPNSGGSLNSGYKRQLVTQDGQPYIFDLKGYIKDHGVGKDVQPAPSNMQTASEANQTPNTQQMSNSAPQGPSTAPQSPVQTQVPPSGAATPAPTQTVPPASSNAAVGASQPVPGAAPQPGTPAGPPYVAGGTPVPIQSPINGNTMQIAPPAAPGQLQQKPLPFLNALQSSFTPGKGSIPPVVNGPAAPVLPTPANSGNLQQAPASSPVAVQAPPTPVAAAPQPVQAPQQQSAAPAGNNDQQEMEALSRDMSMLTQPVTGGGQ